MVLCRHFAYNNNKKPYETDITPYPVYKLYSILCLHQRNVYIFNSNRWRAATRMLTTERMSR